MSRFLHAALLASLALAPAPALAQRAGPPADAPRARWMQGDHQPFQFVLDHRADLKLTDQQVARIEQIAARVKQQDAPLVARLRAALPEGKSPRDMTAEERTAFRQKMQALQPERDQLRDLHRTAMREVRDLMTPEQQTQWRTLMQQNRPARRGGQGMHDGQGRRQGGGRPGSGAGF